MAALARIGDEIQLLLAKDEAAVKLDESHLITSFLFVFPQMGRWIMMISLKILVVKSVRC